LRKNTRNSLCRCCTPPSGWIKTASNCGFAIYEKVCHGSTHICFAGGDPHIGHRYLPILFYVMILQRSQI
jgi:hypothetical protein